MNSIKIVLCTRYDDVVFTLKSRKFLGLDSSIGAQDYFGALKIVEIPSDIEKWDVMSNYYDGVHYEVIVEIGRIFH